MEDWAEIRRLHRAEQMPIKAIARMLGVGRNTVRRALVSDEPPRYQRPAKDRAWLRPQRTPTTLGPTPKRRMIKPGERMWSTH